MDLHCKETFDERLIQSGYKGFPEGPICIGRLGYSRFTHMYSERHMERMERHALRGGKEKLYLSCTIQADTAKWESKKEPDWSASDRDHSKRQ